MNTFFKGTLLLVIAAFIGECLEFVINVVLAKELGEEGLGLYMSILPSIIFIAVLASLELPISISKFVAEKDKKFHQSMIKHATHFIVLFTILLVVIVAFVIPQISIFDKYHPIVRLLVIVLIPIISLSSIAKGYFLGSHHMGKIALANFLKKAAQLVLLVLIFKLFQFEQEVAILIALCTLVGSEFIVFVYLITTFFIQLRHIKLSPSEEMSGKNVRKNLLAISLPTTSLRIFHAASFAAKPFLIKVALMRAGVVESMAMVQYGKLAGVAMTIGFFPSFIAFSLMIALIPTVSEAYAKHDFRRLHTLLKQVMLITFMYALPAVFIFYFYAESLTNLFFKDSPAAGYLQLLIPYFLFHFFVFPMQAFLIGMGLVKDALIHFVWSTTVSFSLMFALGSMEQLQMDGVIIGMNTGAVLVMLMHYVTICNKLGLSLFGRILADKEIVRL